MLTSLALAVALLAPQPIGFGTHGLDAQRVRQVVCVDMGYVSALECLRALNQATADINAALGWQHYEVAGIITHKGAQQAYEAGIFVVGFSRVPPNTRGITIPARRKGEPGIERAVIAISVAEVAPAERVMTLTHELLHGMGMDHAPCDGAWQSIMAPALDCPARADHLTWLDKLTLRLVFGRTR